MSDDEGINLLREIKGNLDQIKDRLAGGEVAVRASPGGQTEASSTNTTTTPETTTTGETGPVLQTPASATNVRVETETTETTVEAPPDPPKQPKPSLPWKRKASA